MQLQHKFGGGTQRGGNLHNSGILMPETPPLAIRECACIRKESSTYALPLLILVCSSQYSKGWRGKIAPDASNGLFSISPIQATTTILHTFDDGNGNVLDKTEKQFLVFKSSLMKTKAQGC